MSLPGGVKDMRSQQQLLNAQGLSGRVQKEHGSPGDGIALSTPIDRLIMVTAPTG